MFKIIKATVYIADVSTENMPSYELSVIVRSALQRPELKDALKRVCTVLYDKGAVIRNMENLGSKELPYSMKKNGVKHQQGNYFIIKFDSSFEAAATLKDTYRKDDDVIRVGVVNNEPEPRRACLDGPCLFGEIVLPQHDKLVYSKKVYRKLKYPRDQQVSKRH